MYEDARFEELHQQFEPMIYHVMRKLGIYKNKHEFYQVGCIALWEASLRFNKEKGEFKSYAYSYMLGRMKSALTENKKKEERESQSEDIWVEDETTYDDFSTILWESLFKNVSSVLSENQCKWVKAYCLYGNTPSEIAEDEGVSVAAVKGWRKEAIGKMREYFNRKDSGET
ncbi:sigma-70 family RNA polymerase sigma factor [Metabacillus halosaccharovorans]|uniref:Sigma-70 family RNA polymerase sigma factor n=1 Tax=Metabacillus halosaccharovorans TaxID=930124 RepID=A0ABT3DCN6_9BACI|nr:sigma-70 family RNA polymerase sigma factor [Metabacillus halosaccharovorans]MCV9884472.1 sigma-70 family RNA polymerase sigma factor [Metabacillus halosaccharovorans]